MKPVLQTMALAVVLSMSGAGGSMAAGAPVYIAVDGAFSLLHSTSAQSIEKGVRAAAHEINAAGGVLGGRPLEVITTDNRSMPARGIQNIRTLAAKKDLVAVVSGRFTPVVIETLPYLHNLKLINLAAWSSGDPVIEHDRKPNYVFRLSLRDSLAMPKILGHARAKGIRRIGLLLTNTSWGRSNEAAAHHYLSAYTDITTVGTVWANWRDKTLISYYNRLCEQGAEAIILVANDDEAAVLIKEMAALPPAARVPVLSHWGVTGGNFIVQAGPPCMKLTSPSSRRSVSSNSARTRLRNSCAQRSRFSAFQRSRRSIRRSASPMPTT